MNKKYLPYVLFLFLMFSYNFALNLEVKHEPISLNCNYPFKIYILDNEEHCDFENNCWGNFNNATLILNDNLKVNNNIVKELNPSLSDYYWDIECENPSMFEIEIIFEKYNDRRSEKIFLDLSNNSIKKLNQNNKQSKIEEYETPNKIEYTKKNQKENENFRDFGPDSGKGATLEQAIIAKNMKSTIDKNITSYRENLNTLWFLVLAIAACVVFLIYKIHSKK
ncbi:hypothetical protein GF323_05165 [Candidatus Woesearchaeota archaeon]|nr:hypothetical protein [Candidatus Woesearchaeota archaeon]